MRRRLIAVLSMVALALGIAIAGPANVAAAASGCSFYKGGTMVQVKCSGGSGHYQAIAVCKKAYWNPLAPETKVSYGGFKKARSNKASLAVCTLGYLVSHGTVGWKS